MILFIGGMFGVLEESGALKAGVDRLLTATRGNINVLAPVLMLVIACGSTFLGLISEYLVIIPMVVLLAERLGYDALVGVAMVTIAAKIGYLTSVTNPLPLVIAQPIVGVPVFSGAGFRLRDVRDLPANRHRVPPAVRARPQWRRNRGVRPDAVARSPARHVGHACGARPVGGADGLWRAATGMGESRARGDVSRGLDSSSR